MNSHRISDQQARRRSWPMDMPYQEWEEPEESPPYQGISRQESRQSRLSQMRIQMLTRDTPRSLVPLVPTPPRCMICLEDINPDDLSYKCSMCTSNHVCSNCLKEWFMDACKNESKMPPMCCSAIPLSSVSKLLTQTQIDLYKSKHEEWLTPDRLYCPRLSCSAFISPRLYVSERAFSGSSNSVSRDNNNVQPISGGSPRSINSRLSFNYTISPIGSPLWLEQDNGLPDSAPSNSCVTCPRCSTLICTKCHSFRHDDECPKTDLDLELETQLKKWKIKRCPKCRTGVKKVYGCPHMLCRCGAQFCFKCLAPMLECNGCVVDEGSDNELEQDEFVEDDLDGRAGFYDGDGREFGAEPSHYGSHYIWQCDHILSEVWFDTDVPDAPRTLECQLCLREAKVRELPVFGQEHRGEGREDEIAWECTRNCGMVICGGCLLIRWFS